MIYLDNAATGGYKIPAVTDSATNVIKNLSANPGRSGHRLSVKGAELVFNTRSILAKAFGAPSVNNVIFTANCTDAINKALFGTLKKGDHVITTVYEHNSVLRPLYHLEQSGVITLSIAKGNGDNLISEILSLINKNTRLVAITGASNVTGEVLPWRDLAHTLKAKNVLLLLDGAQAGGHLPINMVEDKISLLCLAGHKALGGITGVGVLIIGEDVDVNPTLFGGTGVDTFSKTQPLFLPEKLEAGTLNLPAIVALGEGVLFTQKNLTRSAKRLTFATEKIIGELQKIRSVSVYSTPNPCGIVAFSDERFDSATLSGILSDEYDIATRGGYHCAPLMHEHLKTKDAGLVRVSLSPFNTDNEINNFLTAVKLL